jgi:hypothetical protein
LPEGNTAKATQKLSHLASHLYHFVILFSGHICGEFLKKFMRKLLYSIVIAFAVSACIENDVESPSTTASPENLTATGKTATGPEELGQRELEEIKALKKTPITQEEFDQIIANAPPGQPIVIKRRSGHTLQIGQPYAPRFIPNFSILNLWSVSLKEALQFKTHFRQF